MLPLLLLACGAAPPTITAVDPAEPKPGDQVQVLGSDFQEGAVATIAGAPAVLTVAGAAMVQVDVADFPAGPHPLVITNPDGQSATWTLTVAELQQAELVLCDPDYTAYTQLAGGRKLIKIDIHRKGSDTPESMQIGFAEIEAVEYEARAQGDALCSAIVLRMKNGRRIIYEDSKELVFKKKAQEVANLVGVPIDVTHEDPAPQPPTE
jgi:hypothetical protein